VRDDYKLFSVYFWGGECNLSRISNHSEDLNPLNEQKKNWQTKQKHAPLKTVFTFYTSKHNQFITPENLIFHTQTQWRGFV